MVIDFVLKYILRWFCTIIYMFDDTSKSFNNLNVIIEFYVYDLVIIGNNVDLLFGLKKQLIDTFEMNDLGLLHFFLGISNCANP